MGCPFMFSRHQEVRALCEFANMFEGARLHARLTAAGAAPTSDVPGVLLLRLRSSSDDWAPAPIGSAKRADRSSLGAAP